MCGVSRSDRIEIKKEFRSDGMRERIEIERVQEHVGKINNDEVVKQMMDETRVEKNRTKVGH